MFEVKAGKMSFIETDEVGSEQVPHVNRHVDTPASLQLKYKVEADLRRGKIVLQRASDGAVHLKWLDRYTNTAEEDYLVFPGDQVLEKVETGRPADRVYLLNFRTNPNRRAFFWLQESDKSKDQETISKLNEHLKNPALFGIADVDPNDPTQQSLLQLIQSLGGPSSSSAAGNNNNNSSSSSSNNNNNTSSGTGTNTGSRPVQIADLSSILAGISGNQQQQQVSSTNTTASSSALSTEDMQRALQGVAAAMQNSASSGSAARHPNLAEIVRSQDVTPLLDDPEVRNALIPLLPESLRNEEELRSTLSSPQLRQALIALSEALQSGNFNTVMASFGLNPAIGSEALARGDGIGAFLQALEAQENGSLANNSNSITDADTAAALAASMMMDEDEEQQDGGDDDDNENFYE